MKLPVGTQSVLWGVHQCLWHPLTVFLAWKRVYGRYPSWWETISIFCHDSIGYWGCTDMDGDSGVNHPRGGAALAAKIVGMLSPERAYDAYFLCLYHSSTFATLARHDPSDLYLPDKVSILMEPKWWYLFRARLSGELYEYIDRSPKVNASEWFDWYKKSIQKKLNAHDRLSK